MGIVTLATIGFCMVAIRGTGGLADPTVARTLVGMACIYALRLALTNFVFLKRSVPWSETLVVSIWVTIILTVYALGAIGGPVLPEWLWWPALLLYITGSTLNTASEAQRHRFKQDPANRGQLFTGGLFRYSMHINYFGDTVLFTGFAFATLHYWSLGIPLVMTASFLFGHIKRMDGYLLQKYGDAFRDYARRTKKFVPFLY